VYKSSKCSSLFKVISIELVDDVCRSAFVFFHICLVELQVRWLFFRFLLVSLSVPPSSLKIKIAAAVAAGSAAAVETGKIET